jgi:glutamine synthetase
VIADDTVAAFERYNVLSRRELEARFEVWVEQYAVTANIEAETARSIAKTMLLPAAIRYATEVSAGGVDALSAELRPLIESFVAKIGELEAANIYPDEVEGLELAEYARDNQLAKMHEVREVADALELIVADDLWPLPKYSEILFIK